MDLDPGETQAIALAEELHADRILLDETKARKIAVARGLKVAGTLAVLFEAHERGLLDFARTIDELRATTFYLDERLVRTILNRLQER
jgi:predicted nucleic acid-binding protein